MKKNVLIVNGNIEYAEELKGMIMEVNPYINIDIVSDMKDVYEYLMNTTVDMFVLDSVIDIKNRGDMSGIRLAEQIRENNKYILTPLIFVSARKDPELYAYEELNCLGFFVKPFSKEDFQAKVKRGLYYHTPRNEDKTLFFRKGNMICPIRIKDIVYIESVEHIMNIHLLNGDVEEVFYKTYRSLLREADSELLFQCNRSVVVNKMHILGLDIPNRCIQLKYNMGALDIGSTYKKRVKEEFTEIIF